MNQNRGPGAQPVGGEPAIAPTCLVGIEIIPPPKASDCALCGGAGTGRGETKVELRIFYYIYLFAYTFLGVLVDIPPIICEQTCMQNKSVVADKTCMAPCRRFRGDQNGEDTRTFAESSYTTQLRVHGYRQCNCTTEELSFECLPGPSPGFSSRGGAKTKKRGQKPERGVKFFKYIFCSSFLG